MDRLTAARRAPRTTTPGNVELDGTEQFSQHWQPDRLGNWRLFRQYDRGEEGTLVATEEKTITPNVQNQIAAIVTKVGLPWVVPQYDRAGNMTRVPRPGQPDEPLYCTYDYWNRLIRVHNKDRKVLAEYDYDGLHRRVAKRTYNESGELTEHRRFYYSPDWQELEERVLSDTLFTPERWYMWGMGGPDDLVARVRQTGGGEEILYPLQDAQGHVSGLVNRTGDAAEFYPSRRSGPANSDEDL